MVIRIPHQKEHSGPYKSKLAFMCCAVRTVASATGLARRATYKGIGKNPPITSGDKEPLLRKSALPSFAAEPQSQKSLLRKSASPSLLTFYRIILIKTKL